MPRPKKITVPPAPSPEHQPAPPGQVSVDEIVQDIATAIIEKRLPPGTWLREQALGRVYQVSRTKVRAALLTLSKDKLIEMIPDKGAFVSQPGIEEARELFCVRRVLESEVVRLFVAGAREPDYQRLEQHVEFERAALKAGRTSGTVREQLLGDFHIVLAELAGNRILAEMVREMVARSSLIAMHHHSSNDPQCSSDEHEALLHLCRQGHPEEAVAHMAAHLQRIEASLQLGQQRPARQLDLVKSLLS